MDIQIVTEFGSGLHGTVYLVHSGGKAYAYKVEKFRPPPASQPLLHPYYRQLDFDAKVARKHPDKFLVLHSFGIIEDCGHMQRIPESVRAAVRKEIQKNNRLKQCTYLMYKPVLWFTFRDFENRIFSSKKLYFKVMYQLIEQLNIMRKAGFCHGDVHRGNILTDRKRYYLVDYGRIWNVRYPLNKDDKRISDMIMLLWNVAIQNPAEDYAYKHKYRVATFETIRSRLRQYPGLADLKKHLPSGISRKTADEMLMLCVCVVDYGFYKQCLGLRDPVFAPMAFAGDAPLVLYCLRHSMEPTYSSILRYIRSKK